MLWVHFGEEEKYINNKHNLGGKRDNICPNQDSSQPKRCTLHVDFFFYIKSQPKRYTLHVDFLFYIKDITVSCERYQVLYHYLHPLPICFKLWFYKSSGSTIVCRIFIFLMLYILTFLLYVQGWS